ncbi:sugar ABC transporter [Sorangium cellulosum]|uniref:Sugar ABC transporter n=1 Tax=Sorangium cellulosum TaxID=56 RepID=A0A2L0EM25_SORCE|nr:substrate-binding domain-containing protein [Sorangium cellulosum]AUX40351.1 sugar ABC transporter [Sorangium cellulosum]
MNRIGRRWAAAFGLALMTAACGSGDTTGKGEQVSPIQRAPTPKSEFTAEEIEATLDALVTEINEGAIEPMQMAILLKEIGGFFTPITTGANRAMGELGVTGNVVGHSGQGRNQQERAEAQGEQIGQAVADGAAGIGVSPFGDAIAAGIDEAVAGGVPVVTLDTDAKDSKRSIYVGTISESAGDTAGKTLLALLRPAPGTVVIHGADDPSWVDGMTRMLGARRVLEDAGYTVVVRPITWSPGGEVADVEAMAAQIETADPPVMGLLGLHNVSYRCAMAAEAAGATELPVVAFDFEPKTVEYMRQGLIKATHTQRQYYAGYLVPYILYGIKIIGPDATKAILAPRMVDESRLNVGLDVVPWDKVDEYDTFLDSISVTQ